MNLEDEVPNKTGFSWRDLNGKDRWESFTVSASITVVGTPTYYGRSRCVGRLCYFQIQFSASTSVATTAGTSYFTLPFTANSQGLAGLATMTNETTDIAVGVCHIDTATSRCYPPTQLASGNTFKIAGFYEI